MKFNLCLGDEGSAVSIETVNTLSEQNKVGKNSVAVENICYSVNNKYLLDSF